jgi:hypothetical protein
MDLQFDYGKGMIKVIQNYYKDLQIMFLFALYGIMITRTKGAYFAI